MKKLNEKQFFGCPEDYLESTRYNGGWIKEITGLDKSKNNGYSLIGSFKGKSGDTYEVGHLYLDCDIRGSRKNQFKHYKLFTIKSDGAVKEIAYQEDARDWAINLWDAVEQFLDSDEKDNPLEVFPDEELIAEMKRRGIL